MSRRARKIIEYITNIPVVNPDIVTGISLMLLFIFLKATLSYTTLLLSHITFCIPYVILSVMPKLSQMRDQTYEAALDLGAKPLYAVCRVVLPEIKSGVATGAILAFTLSLDDFVVSLFTRQGVQTLSTLIYGMARRGINPKINALSAMMFVTVLILLLIVNLRAVRGKEG
jgi:spermidine/putrescine transport system permease protein